MSADKPNPQLIRWELFLGIFRERVSRRDEERPTVRYWKSAQLRSLIQEIRLEHRAELLTTFPPGKALLGRLEKIGWIKPVSIVWSKANTQIMYRVSLGDTADATIDPLELLQGYEPKGAICYLGALRYHELTTQVPRFYHIAKMRSGKIPTPTNEHSKSAPVRREDKPYNPMGTEIFTMGESVFYETSRYPALMPGIQVRLLSARNSLRITDLEQTLLDALTHPFQCGGSAVVFESWERASERIDPVRLCLHLKSINQPSLWRRAATMLSIVAPSSDDAALAAVNEEARKAIASQSEQEVISLLPDHQFAEMNSDWRVLVP